MIEPRSALRQAGLSPKKAFGQHFLVVDAIGQSIAKASVPDSEIGSAYVVEWGAGLGALTAQLLPRAKCVFAVERDRDLVPLIRNAFAEAIGSGHLCLLETDAQTVVLREFFAEAGPSISRVLAGNLPYSITGKLLRQAMEHADCIDRAVFMVQAEVAERLLASPGTSAYGALTVFAQAAFEVVRVCKVPPACFYPSPLVHSAVVKLTPRPQRMRETETFRLLVQSAFSQRRKTLQNAWRSLKLPQTGLAELAGECGISLAARGETLSVADFARMADALLKKQLDPSKGKTGP